MSASPQQEDSTDRYDEDIEENDQQNTDELDAGAALKDAQQPKRGRGRPKGSKNKKSGVASASTAPSEGAPLKKKRGRPPKEKKPDDSGAEEPPRKRRRGRPRKDEKLQIQDDDGPAAVSAPTIGEGSGLSGEPSAKKKRGRPPKKT